jgi:hypothetical protein
MTWDAMSHFTMSPTNDYAEHGRNQTIEKGGGGKSLGRLVGLQSIGGPEQDWGRGGGGEVRGRGVLRATPDKSHGKIPLMPNQWAFVETIM